MTKNPFYNGAAASTYIILIVVLINTLFKTIDDNANSTIAPIIMISLFTLSAAMMGYLFCYEPIQLYFSGKKKQAIDLFLKTTAVFAGITVLILIVHFLGVFY